MDRDDAGGRCGPCCASGLSFPLVVRQKQPTNSRLYRVVRADCRVVHAECRVVRAECRVVRVAAFWLPSHGAVVQKRWR